MLYRDIIAVCSEINTKHKSQSFKILMQLVRTVTTVILKVSQHFIQICRHNFITSVQTVVTVNTLLYLESNRHQVTANRKILGSITATVAE
jgi:hypothetical protein